MLREDQGQGMDGKEGVKSEVVRCSLGTVGRVGFLPEHFFYDDDDECCLLLPDAT